MLADAAFSTSGVPPPRRAAAWSAAIAASYFPLDLRFSDPERFSGRLARHDFGEVLISRLRSRPLAYRRRPEHLREAGEEDFLLTIPRASPVRFSQMGREVACPPGGFILERGNEPYEFSYAAPCDLIAVKIGMAALAPRLPDPGRWCAIGFDAREGVGALLIDLVRGAEAQAHRMPRAAREAVGRQVLDLLALAVENDARAARSAASSVRAAHLRRIAAFIAARLADPDLGPEAIAAGCGISTRYLHDLCRGDGPTARERVREARLQAARRALTRRGEGRGVGEIAFAVGFSDASQFSRAYRARFGESPRETRAAARRG